MVAQSVECKEYHVLGPEFKSLVLPIEGKPHERLGDAAGVSLLCRSSLPPLNSQRNREEGKRMARECWYHFTGIEFSDSPGGKKKEFQ